MIEIEEGKENIELCTHKHEEKTLTIWIGESFERCTWTCLVCKRIRGRC